MKITKSRLRKIIQEEISRVVEQSVAGEVGAGLARGSVGVEDVAWGEDIEPAAVEPGAMLLSTASFDQWAERHLEDAMNPGDWSANPFCTELRDLRDKIYLPGYGSLALAIDTAEPQRPVTSGHADIDNPTMEAWKQEHSDWTDNAPDWEEFQAHRFKIVNAWINTVEETGNPVDDCAFQLGKASAVQDLLKLATKA